MKQWELIKLAERLLDTETRQEYGDDAFFVLADALGITRGSMIEYDRHEHIVFRLNEDEVKRRIESILTGQKRGLSSSKALQHYFELHPPLPDPLAIHEDDKPVKKTRKLGGSV